MYPASVDLRSAYEQVYSQGSESSCGPHAMTSALDCMFERSTGVQHRFDKAHLWRWAKWHNGILETVDTGTDSQSLCKALNVNGAKLVDQIITGFSAIPTKMEFGSDTLKRLLCMGIPVIYTIRMPLNLGSLTGQWKQHRLEIDRSGSQDRNHFVCVVGYDDDSQHYLFENSWGAGWGDGGFFGVPYSQMFDPAFFLGANHIDRAPISIKPAEGYTMPQALMFTADKVAFSDRSAAALRQHLMDSFGTGGVESLVAELAEWGVSDKHLEQLAGWPRGTVRQFATDNASLDWSKQVWDQI